MTITVFVNYLVHSRFQDNTDIRYPYQYGGLADGRTIAVTFNESKTSAFLVDLAILLRHARRRWWLPNHLSFVQRILDYFARHNLVFPWQLRGVDVVLTFWFFPILLTWRKPPIIFSSGFPSNEYTGVSNDSERAPQVRQLSAWFQRSSVIGFPARSWIDHFNRIEPRFGHKLHFLPLFLSNLASIQADEFERKFSHHDKTILLFVGADGARKGIHQLLAALSILYRDHFEVAAQLKLIAVTQTRIQPPIGIEFVHHTNLSNVEVHAAMRAAHIFCLPTRRDSYGLVFIEAMASGCAIVADDQSPRTEFFDNGKCGILTDGSPEEIAAAILRLTTDFHYAETLARRALDRFKSTYARELVREQHTLYIKQLMSP